jgi:holo-[acyl-carrier protein] synthase
MKEISDIGIDMEKTGRFAMQRDAGFLKDNFTKEELEYAFSKDNAEESLAGMFCAKEAIRKTISKPVLMRNIKITHAKDGKPTAKVEGSKNTFRISISHTKDSAIAIALKTK